MEHKCERGKGTDGGKAEGGPCPEINRPDNYAYMTSKGDSGLLPQSSSGSARNMTRGQPNLSTITNRSSTT